jgi:hypothetical protein
MALLKIVQMQRLLPFADLVARVERLAGGVSAPGSGSAPRAPEIAAAPRPLPRPESPPVAAPASRAQGGGAAHAAAHHQRDPARPAAPTSAAPAPVAFGSRDGDLTDGPDAVLQAMVSHAQTRPSLSQPLRAARARQDGETLVLEFTPDFSVFADLHADEYRELARKASGRPLKVKITSGAAESPAAVAGEPRRRPRTQAPALIEEASREPRCRKPWTSSAGG